MRISRRLCNERLSKITPSHTNMINPDTCTWTMKARSTLIKWLNKRVLPLFDTSFNKLWGKPPQYTPPLQVDLWPFDLESGVQVMCDVGYLRANFSLPRPLCFRLRPDVRDRQTDVRRASSLNAPYPRGIITEEPEYVPFDLTTATKFTISIR